MPISDLASATSRAPRLRVLVNGLLVSHPTLASIISNNHYAADRFHLSVVLGGNSAATWCATPDMLIDVQMSLDAGSGWTSLLQGRVDTVTFDPLARTVQLAGRDLTAGLIEARTQEAFSNQTASEIARLLAARHNLDADIVDTPTIVGRYWEREHDRITLNQFARATTEWDLLVTLAQREGFDVWVSGNVLHFRPSQSQPATGFTLRPVATDAGPANITSLRLERSLTLARDIEVTVKSWNSRQRAAFLQTARSATATGRRHANPLRYAYVIPNLTPDDALKFAQSKLAELSRRERIILVDLPGELAMRPRMQIRLEATQTDFDQSYWIDEIERRMDFRSGFTQRIRASNANQTSQTTTPADTIGTPWTVFSTP